jgi:molybdenum cofactor synthesis domain-containing protein
VVEVSGSSGELRAAVVVASNRAAKGVYEDTTGPLIVEALRGLGFTVGEPLVRPDGGPVGTAIAAAVAEGARAVLTTGGTGLTPTDRTPEVTRPLLDREVPGIAEAIRAAGVAKGVPTAALSRGVAGVVGECLVVNLPGSRGGVKDALEVLGPVLVHAVEQIRGSDH